jgi:hypothetical protein
MQILATYDGHETGVSEDNLDGGFVVNNAWFKIAHPMALKHLLGTIAWMPEVFGPARENHIVASTAVVDSVVYKAGQIDFSTFDAPRKTATTLRLAFAPESVGTEAKASLPLRNNLEENGYTLRPLPGGDCLVTVRHDGIRRLSILGGDRDAQRAAASQAFVREGPWSAEGVTEQKGASVTLKFTGNQVRLAGDFGPDGGLAEVYLDGAKQLAGIDCWNPAPRRDQVLYYRNGLADGEHTVKIVALGKGNPFSEGAKVSVRGAFCSSAKGTVDFGEGGGPTGPQRMVFGYTGRDDLKDSAGNFWRPATEFIIRTGSMTDSVEKSWWATPVRQPILGTSDPELYRYGVHGQEFWLNATVGPGKYTVRLRFAATRGLDTCENCVTVAINGRQLVRKMDVAATAGGPNRAADLVFGDIVPQNGVIEVLFRGGDPEMGILGEAFVQAVEITPVAGAPGATPITVLARNLLRNHGFEEGVPEQTRGAGTPGPGRWHFSAQGSPGPRAERESAVQAGAEPGVGKEAVRISGQGSSRLAQEVAVRPQSVYRGSVWVLARSAGASGFGHHRGDSAGLILEELDATGAVLVAHPKVAVVEAGPYRYVSRDITTTAKTARVRFVLDTTLGFDPQHGSVTYDQCVLDGPPAPATLVGRVLDERQNPLASAVVSAGKQSVRTEPDGTYQIAGLMDMTAAAIRAEKQGFYAQTKQSVLAAGENRIDFVLPALPTDNLLVNGDFEQGFPAARSMEHGTSGTRGPWRFAFSPGVACYIYPESIYQWRKPRIFRGKEAISHVTDGGGELRLSQEVVVDPNTALLASVWVQGLDVENSGKGFGAGPSDFAGLVIEELDDQGRVIASHARAGIRKATPDFQRIAIPFTTHLKTIKVRYTLLSQIGCIWQQGAAIYDDAALVKAAAQPR